MRNNKRKEELRPVIVDGVTYPEYSVSNTGIVYSHKNKKKYDKNYCVPLKVINEVGEKNGRGGAVKIGLYLEGKRKSYGVHKLVMNAFCPVDLYPPIPITDYNLCPESAKQWIRDTVVINHIDHNPHNNNLDNLEYTTPKDNTRKAVQYYGGNLNNKNILTN